MRRRRGSTSVSGRFSRAELRRCGRRGSQPGASSAHDRAGCAGHGGRGAHRTSIVGGRLACREPGCARRLLCTRAGVIGHRVDPGRPTDVRLTPRACCALQRDFGLSPRQMDQVRRPRSRCGRTCRGGSRLARPRIASLPALMRNSSRPTGLPRVTSGVRRGRATGASRYAAGALDGVQAPRSDLTSRGA